MGISIGLVGLGGFGKAFAPLFKSHPLVDRIGLCDREPERIKPFAGNRFFADKFNERDAYVSLDEICESDMDALVIITQPWLHAPQCIQAMQSGKHVYSAVPIISVPDGDEILDCCDRLIAVCRDTGMSYMLGETTYYRPQAMFCRRKAAEGAFGDFVYAEGEYCHDIDDHCNLRVVQANRSTGAAGREWHARSRKYSEAGIRGGPMHYPTHSTCGPVCTMKAHAVKVTAYGYENRDSQNAPGKQPSITNEIAFFKMSNGATVRIAEMRESPGRLGNDNETFRVCGALGAFSENRWFEIKRPDLANLDLKNLPKPVETRLTDEDMRDPLPPEVQVAFKRAMHQDKNESDLQNMDFVPAGHGGSHPYLVHEFVDAVASGRKPAINIWEASRYMAMGVMAHKSVLQDGATLEVPDWGDCP